MSAAPISIRRAGPEDVPSSKAATAALKLSATPGGNNLFGTTPGGSRIVYSREQLLSLATSPLSHNPPKVSIPAEIRSSPDKSAGVLLASSLGRSPDIGSLKSRNGASRNPTGGLPSSPPSLGSRGAALGSRSPPSSHLPSISTSSTTSPTTPNRTTGFAASMSSPRSPPGNAFNFGGPVRSGSGLLSQQRPVDPTVKPAEAK